MKLGTVQSAVAGVLSLAATVTAVLRNKGGMDLGPIDEVMFSTLAVDGVNGTQGWGTFDQLIDHSNPSLGTFKQRWWYGTQYWKGPGSPIILTSPGEQPADNFNVSYTSLQRLTGLIAQKVGGAVIVLEHRYWGDSSPYAELTEENLKYLTLNNSLKDHTYFAKNFELPFDTSGSSGPSEAPWTFVGGSYSGALAGWLAHLEAGTFWAYHGTSGVVETIGDFWQYFAPVQDATPANCSKDLSSVIDYIDDILMHGSEAQKQNLKAKFLLEDLEDADFGGAIEYGPWQWQSTHFYSESINGKNLYHEFCNYIENVFPNSTNPVPGPEGVGSCKALKGYAKWFKEVFLPGTCESYGYDEFQGTNNVECLKLLNASNPLYHDLSPRNPGNRQWYWMLCNEPFEWWQDGAPEGRPSIVSRTVTQEYQREQCKFWFPEQSYGIAKGLDNEDVNAWTGGWSVTDTVHLSDANGQYDPWRPATVSSDFRPGGPKESTPEHPIIVIPGGVHCDDLYGNNWAVNAEVKAIAEREAEQIKTWLGEFYTQKGKTWPINA